MKNAVFCSVHSGHVGVPLKTERKSLLACGFLQNIRNKVNLLILSSISLKKQFKKCTFLEAGITVRWG